MKKLYLKLKDNQYTFLGVDHTRIISRGIIFNNDGLLALTKINATDKFGRRDYYELPGGGVNEGESIEEGLIREIEEELGKHIDNVVEIAEVKDYYNLIKRKNVNHYFVGKVQYDVKQHLEEKESSLIEKIVWVSLKDAIKLFEDMQDELVGHLVKMRELPILKYLRKLISTNHFDFIKYNVII